jgi:hypothetical protein
MPRICEKSIALPHRTSARLTPASVGGEQAPELLEKVAASGALFHILSETVLHWV